MKHILRDLNLLYVEHQRFMSSDKVTFYIITSGRAYYQRITKVDLSIESRAYCLQRVKVFCIYVTFSLSIEFLYICDNKDLKFKLMQKIVSIQVELGVLDSKLLDHIITFGREYYQTVTKVELSIESRAYCMHQCIVCKS